MDCMQASARAGPACIVLVCAHWLWPIVHLDECMCPCPCQSAHSQAIVKRPLRCSRCLQHLKKIESDPYRVWPSSSGGLERPLHWSAGLAKMRFSGFSAGLSDADLLGGQRHGGRNFCRSGRYRQIALLQVMPAPLLNSRICQRRIERIHLIVYV